MPSGLNRTTVGCSEEVVNSTSSPLAGIGAQRTIWRFRPTSIGQPSTTEADVPKRRTIRPAGPFDARNTPYPARVLAMAKRSKHYPGMTSSLLWKCSERALGQETVETEHLAVQDPVG